MAFSPQERPAGHLQLAVLAAMQAVNEHESLFRLTMLEGSSAAGGRALLDAAQAMGIARMATEQAFRRAINIDSP